MSVLPQRNDPSLRKLDRHSLGVRLLQRGNPANSEASEAHTGTDVDAHLEDRSSAATGREILRRRFLAADRFTRAIGQAIWLRL